MHRFENTQVIDINVSMAARGKGVRTRMFKA